MNFKPLAIVDSIEDQRLCRWRFLPDRSIASVLPGLYCMCQIDSAIATGAKKCLKQNLPIWTRIACVRRTHLTDLFYILHVKYNLVILFMKYIDAGIDI